MQKWLKYLMSLLVLGISFGIYFYAGNFWMAHQRPVGDEPHYLIITQSLIKDHDLDLTNNYAQKDYQAWGYEGQNLDSHVAVRSQNGKQYSFHNIGWPLILYFPFKWWGVAGAVGTAEAVGALLALNIFLLIRSITRKSGVAWLIFLATAFSVPFVIYASQLFNEMLAALLICFAVRMLYERLPNFYSQFFSIAAISFLSWVHVKYIWVSIFLFLVWLYVGLLSKTPKANAAMSLSEVAVDRAKRGNRLARAPESEGISRSRLLITILLSLLYLASGALLSYLFKQWYGTYLPNGQYPLGMKLISPNQIGAGAAGLFLDWHFGLLTYAPIYIFSFAGLIYAFVKDRLLGILLSVTFLAVFLQHAASTNLLGWAPEGRFMIAILPMLAVAGGIIYPLTRTWNKVIFWMTAVWGWVAGYFLIRHPDLNYSVSEPKYLQAISSKLINFTHFFPHIITMDQTPALNQNSLVIAWLTAILALTILTIVFRTREPQTISPSLAPKSPKKSRSNRSSSKAYRLGRKSKSKPSRP